MNAQVLANHPDLCGECPVWDEARQVLYWTDITGQRLYQLDWQSQTESLVLDRFEVTGFALNQDDGLILCSTRGIWRWDRRQAPWLLLDRVDGVKLQLNDCTADGRGRLLTGTCYFDADRSYPPGHLVVVAPETGARILDEGFLLTNGLAFSPSGDRLYFADSAARRIYVYDYHLESGTVSRRRVFAQFGVADGLPDGMTVDAEGFLWCAFWFGSCVRRFDPEGVVERQVRVPALQASSVGFCGADLRTLVVTSANKLDSANLAPPGIVLDRCGGELYALEQEVAGLPSRKTWFA